MDEWAVDILTAKLAGGRSTAAETLERVVEQMQATELLLFIDQFEELFTVATASSPGHFVQLLTAAVRSSRVRVLITVRADFYDRCIEIPELAELLGKGSYPLAAPGFESLLEMITRPADRAGVTFEEELHGRILNDVGSDAGALPLMAFALNRLFEKREVSGRLTHHAYDGFGGLRGAIVNRAEEVMDTVAASLVTGGASEPAVGADVRAQVEQALTQIFRELVDVGEGRNATKRRVPLSRVTASEVSSKLVRSLVDARLLVATGGVDPIRGGAADPMIEVAHEALFTHWRRLRDWIEGVRDDLRLRSQLQRAAVEWNERKKDPAYTWSDERCVDAHRRLQQLSYEPTELERRFLGPLNIDLMLNEINDAATTPERRALIGVRLALLGDPRFGTGLRPNGLPYIEWCDVEGGIVVSGEQRIERQVAPFKIAKYPLTWAQFDVFVRSHDGYSNRVWWEGLGTREEQPGRQIQRYLNHPVENVSWVDATAYCRWLTSRLGHEVRLPTQWEWQLVASGGDPSRPFPWGEWELGRANTREHQLDRTTAVGMFPHGAAPCGALDVWGNVWEWCSDGEDLYPADGNCPAGYRAVCGGSWNFGHETARSDVPNAECSAYRFNSVGFRVACT